MRVTVKSIYERKKLKGKITALTAYDYPLARILDKEGMDIILVGDSLGMVLLGYESTVPVTMREMLHHTKAVSRAVNQALVVADLPFGAYDNADKAVRNAMRLVKEGGADAVKLEGGGKIKEQVEALIGAGVAVMGHLGMTPQTATALGGYKVQGRGKKQAEEILRDALLLDRLGVFSLVLECVPVRLAGQVTRRVRCPTIGIGAGPKTDGQILVSYDMLGYHGSVEPRFARKYLDLENMIRKAVARYRRDVAGGNFPSKHESFS